jgi:acetolactate synthase-1/2/3 large subunit
MEKPGACHIELADDIAAFASHAHPLPVAAPPLPVPTREVLDDAVAMIMQAERPIILAGNLAVIPT